jgi:hypothetical protein
MCELLHIHKSRTTPYRPSANGQVERCNRTLMATVRCFIGKNQRSWDKNIPQLAGALRSSVNRSTGYTPFATPLRIDPLRAVRCSPDSRTSVPQATQSPYPTSSYWVCTLCFYLPRTLISKYSLIRGGILSPLCSGKCVNYFTYINRELPLIVPRRTDK